MPAIRDIVFDHRVRRQPNVFTTRGLTKDEKICVSILQLDFEVLEGGLRGWVRNATAKEAEAIIAALRRVRATDMAHIVRRAFALQPVLTRCEANEEEEYRSLTERAALAQRFDALAKEYRSALRATYTALLAFMHTAETKSPRTFPGLQLSARVAKRRGVPEA